MGLQKRRSRLNKAGKFTVGIALIFEIIPLVHGLTALWQKQWPDLGLSALAMATILVPWLLHYLANRVHLKLPPGFVMAGVVFIFLAQYLGEIRKFYQTFWWWDIFLHGLFGVLAVLFALYMLQSNLKKQGQLSKARFTLFLALLSLCFAMACSAAWELFEYMGDIVLPVKMVKGGLEDTMSDLFSGSLTALLTAAGYYFLWRFMHRDKTRI
ncbi:hypothetical protein HMPREF0322_02017 [Desulfitobacterium hafniense DP7]|uniref:Membrane-spanning protein n=1 Tax=Desulfitobacterium hafniense DP7 TaxID=537010 RepID=G9XM31_DESHA|nr:hypothetical protein [Desulfitobacterium hafniense]EHL07258.1 hypothetical protein HMPREF0322_02017 [Desulfitobacterium hafniense DP7]MEA5024817.1 hypothetical protein [Desulfitobacterium hafniense]